LPPVAYEQLVRKLEKIPCRGFLADWGYTVPLGAPHTGATATLSIDATIGALNTTQPDLSVDTAQYQPPVAISSPLTSLSSTPDEMPLTSPVVVPIVASDLGENMVPVRRLISDPEGAGNTQFVALSDLKYTDDITLSMGGAPLPDPYRPSIDTNPLYRIVSLFPPTRRMVSLILYQGMWSWMAAELVLAGAGKPVKHEAHHDLESLFYVLLGISVLYDELYKLKPEGQLAECFDMYFNTSQPSLLKTITIQSQLGWSVAILKHISPYFHPLVRIFDELRQKIIMPMTVVGHSFKSGDPITHDYMIKTLLNALNDLPDSSWDAKVPSNDGQNGSSVDAKPRLNSETGLESAAQPRSDFKSSPSESHSIEVNTPYQQSSQLERPCMPRPDALRQVSGPGFTSPSVSSRGVVRKQVDDGFVGTRDSKRPRLDPIRAINPS